MTALALTSFTPRYSPTRALMLTLKAGALLLLGVALLHAVVLWWARGELQSSGFHPAGRILYTRMITPAAPKGAEAAVAYAPPVVAVAPKPKAAPAPKAVVVPALSSAADSHAPSGISAPMLRLPTSADEVPMPEEQTPSEQAAPLATASSPQAPALAIHTQHSNIVITNNNIGDSEASGNSMPNSRPFEWPASTRVNYALSGYWRGDLHGSGAFEWVREGEADYQLFLRAKSLVTLELRSRGRVGDTALRPERYEEQTPGRVLAVSFNQLDRKVSFSSITDVIEMKQDMQDRASAIMQLARLLSESSAQLPAMQASGERFKINGANPRGINVWEFAVLGQEAVASGSGTLNAWHLQLARSKPGDMGMDLWLSDELQRLPVRIKLSLSNDVFLDLTMTTAEQK